MRKVKVLAFVLAALMVVAAFAGCGTKQIKTDVTTLDERVTALETLLKQVSETVNGGATKDDITEILDAITANKAEAAAGDKTLADAIAKITADQATANAALKADLEKLVDAAKKDQATGDTALQVAIEKLNNSLAATNKALEDSVKDLLAEIKKGDDANTKALADAINAINKAQADQTAASNKALEDAIKALQDSIKAGDDKNSDALLAAIEALNKKQDEQNSAIADALAGLKETIEKNKEEAGVNASVQAKAAAYMSNLTTAKTSYDFEEEHYFAADFVAIQKAIANGMTAVQTATTVEAVDAAYAAVVAELAKYERVDVALYNAYKTLMNKINFESQPAIKAYATQVSAAKEHYTDESPITSYVYAAGKTVDLVAAATSFSSAFNYLNATLVDSINTVKSQINAISRVQYYALGNKDKAASNTSSTGISSNKNAVTTAKNNYDALVKQLSDNNVGAWARYLDDALINNVNATKLNEHIATVNALAKADALLAMYVSYDYATNTGSNNIFAEYTAITETPAADRPANTSGERSWFNTKDNYTKINARIAAWRADNPIVDDKNAEAMLNNHAEANSAGNFYKTYLGNQTKMNQYVAKYDEFVASILPRIKAAQKFTEISTENVQIYIDIRAAIDAWLVVTPDGPDTNKEPDLVIDGYDKANSQYMKMVRKAFNENGRTSTFVFEETTKVQPFFADKVAKAEAVAKFINKKIAALDATAVSAEVSKRLEGYKLSDNGAYFYIPEYNTDSADSITVTVTDLIGNDGVVAADVDIAKFNSVFVETVIDGTDVYSYDLSYLLDLDILAEVQAQIAANVAALKTKTAALVNARTDIMKAIATEHKLTAYSDSDSKYDTQAERDAHIAKVTLNQKGAVDALKASYEALVANGFNQNGTREWAQYKVGGVAQAGKYTNNPILNINTVYEVTDLIKNVKTLNDFQSNLAKFFKLINSANTFATFKADTVDTEIAWTAKTSAPVWNAEANKDDTYYTWSYIKNTNKLNDGKTGFNYQSTPTGTAKNGQANNGNKPTAGNDAYTVLAAIEHAWVAYAEFVKDNGGKTYAALETALVDNNMDDFKLIAIKNKAWEAVNGESQPANWSATYGDYATQKGIVLNAIKNASSVEAISDILVGFCAMGNITIDAIDFAGAHIFHTDGTLHVHTTQNPCTHADHTP